MKNYLRLLTNISKQKTKLNHNKIDSNLLQNKAGNYNNK